MIALRVLSPALLLAALAYPPATRGEAVAPPQEIRSLEFVGLTTIPSGGEFRETTVGGLSGITYDAARDRYYAISDDPANRSPSRFYTLEIDLTGTPVVSLESVTILTDRDEKAFPERVIDGEGIALTPEGDLLISSEGNLNRGVPPSLRRFRLDGRETHRYRIPSAWLPNRNQTRGVRHNNAMESLSVLGDGFFTATENALVQDGPATDVGQTGRVRISRVSRSSGKIERQWLYELDAVVAAPSSSDAFRTNGLVELLALSDDTLLAMERSFTLGVGNSVRLYTVSLEGADDVRKRRDGRDIQKAKPVRKRLLIDLDGFDTEPDNVEGLTLGPRLPDGRRSLVLISDDNFSPLQTTQVWVFAIGPSVGNISAIQGAGHRSPVENHWVAAIPGVVTRTNLEGRDPGFWFQSEAPDDDPDTSEGLFVSVRNLNLEVEHGSRVEVTGHVVELERSNALPVTRLEAQRVEALEGDVSLPAVVRIGAQGREVPSQLDDDGLSEFDSEADAIDFFESLEGMRVEVPPVTVIGPTTRFGTFVVDLGSAGASQASRTKRGGLLLEPDSSRPERLTVEAGNRETAPSVAVGDRIVTPTSGVLDYAFGGFRLLADEGVSIEPSTAIGQRSLDVTLEDRFNIATYNVENLDASDSDEKFERLAQQIESPLRGPDVVALQEIQDDSGSEDDGVVTAAATLEKLISAIEAEGGPSYHFAQVDPENNADGGAPGGNIRVAFLYNPARVALAESALWVGPGNPARLFDDSPAFRENPETGFEASRKPLAAEFLVGDKRILVINVHLKSKRGDDGTFGPRQPPQRPTEVQRLAQIEEIGRLVSAVRESDPTAQVVVLGDFNDHEFREPIRRMAGFGLRNLIEEIAPEERYTYNYEGISQVLDHIFVSPDLAPQTSGDRVQIETLRLNSDFQDERRASDHNPVRAGLSLQAGSTSPPK